MSQTEAHSRAFHPARMLPWLLLSALIWSGCGEAPEETSSGSIATQEAELSPAVRLSTQWVKTGIGAPFTHLAIDAAGNRLVTLTYNRPTSLGGVPLPHHGILGYSGYFAVAKLSPQGSVLWAKGFGPPLTALPAYAFTTALATDPNGNIFIGGSLEALQDRLSIGGCSLTNGAFLAKLSATGDCIWARNTAPEPHHPFGFVDFAADPQGNLVALAEFQGPSLMSPTSMMLISYDGRNGHPRWTRTFEQADPLNSGVQGRAVAVDEFARPYVVGSFGGSVRFGGQLYESPPNGPDIRYAPYVAAFQANGAVRWIRRLSERGDASSVSTRDGHLMVGLFDFEAVVSSLASFDLSGTKRWERRVGRPAPVATELGPLKEVVVAVPIEPGISYQLSSWNRVTGELLASRNFSSVNPISDLAVSPRDGSITATGTWYGTTDLGTGPLVAQGNGDGFAVTLNP